MFLSIKYNHHHFETKLSFSRAAVGAQNWKKKNKKKPLTQPKPKTVHPTGYDPAILCITSKVVSTIELRSHFGR